MKRKISGALAASLIVGQFQGVAVAETTQKLDDQEKNNENISNTDEVIADQVTTEVLEDEKNKQENEQLDNSEEEKEDVETPVNEDENFETSETEGNEINQKDEMTDLPDDLNGTENKKESNESLTSIVDYRVTGKLELDLNFALPIKHTDKATTNLTVKIKKDNTVIDEIQLGVDSIARNNTSYQLEALNSKKQPLSEGEDVSFYHLTVNELELGTYTLEISGSGYQTATIDNIDITNASKRVLVGTSENKIVIDDKGTTDDTSDDITEVYPALLLAGETDGNGKVEQSDYESVKAQIKNGKTKNSQFDLNRDGKVDITDLTYIHQNINQSVQQAVILDTDLIVNPDTVSVKVSETTVVEKGSDIKDLLKDNGESVSFKTTSDSPISPENPVNVELDLSGTTRSGATNKVEQITLKAPSENAPTSGTIVIPGAGENGTDLTVSFDESNSKEVKTVSRNGESQSEIIVNLGQQVAVSKISINVTGSRSNKNLTEIAKVEFLNNVYEELPKPNMNIPVINKFTSGTAVGNEHMVIGWNHETNVTGYELKIEELNEDGTVKETQRYRTSQNSLKIEGIKGYSIYRVSIQSIAGDWSSGFKDEQEGYEATTTGNTNLANNANDKDGKPDNVNSDYIPVGWDSTTGLLSSNVTGENANQFGADSIVELQVIPETAPEGPEGITVKSEYESMVVSWKSHAKAKDYDLYYRKVGGDGAWIKANDPNHDYVDIDKSNDIPDGVTDLSPEQKKDKDELIRGTQYTITGLEENASYEIKMTATNHHGTGGLSKTYLGKAGGIVIPSITKYKLINYPGSDTVQDVQYSNWHHEMHPNGIEDKFAIVDGNYKTYWTSSTWNTSYGTGPLVTFDQEYTIDTIRLTTRLDGVYAKGSPYDYVPVRYFDSKTNQFIEIQGSYKTLRDPENQALYYEIKLPYPVTTKQIQTALRIHPSYNAKYSSISEIMFYHYDSIEEDVEALFKDDLKLELSETVTQEIIDDLIKRVNTIDSVTMEYHPKQDQLLSDLERAQQLLSDVQLSDNIKELDSEIRNTVGKTIGQSNNYQALGVAVKPGDKVNIYIGSANKNTKFELAITQFNGESGTAYQTYSEKLTVGKNEIVIPESAFTMDCEKGGNLYLRFSSDYNDNQVVKVRVSGGTEIPHLNVNNLINDLSKAEDVKSLIRTYIRDLKSYVNTLPNRYPEKEDKVNNIYKYDPQTSILNATDIEGDRITLSLAADQVLKGITDGALTEDEQVERLYQNLLAWEQLMEVSYLQQGLIEQPIDFDGDGKITNNPLTVLNGKSERQFFNENRAPLNRINIKYQRMFTGAFMYASGHHVGIGYGSNADMMRGVPFKFDENGNLVNADEGQLFGWGINHEIGHVHDVNGLTYAEVTNNILALISQTFDDIDESRIEGHYDQVYEKVTSGSVGLASSGLTKLAMFWQLHLAYDNHHTYEMLELNKDNNLENDSFYAKLYRVTREKGIAENESGHDRTAQTFIMRSSDAVGKDLREFFEKWGIVASPKTNAYLDKQNYPKEDKAIYYLNDQARRVRLEAIENNNLDSLVAATDTKVNAEFGLDEKGNKITDRTYLNQKTVPFKLSVTKDKDKILGYEIIKLEATSQGMKEVPVGFVERNQESDVTEYTHVVDVINNRTFGYKVRAYDYNLNVTEETEVGTVKVSHDGSIKKSDWTFDTNTRGIDDESTEDSGHGHDEHGTINYIKDNDSTTVYNAVKATNNTGQVAKGDPYVTIEMDQIKSVVGLKYTPGTTTNKLSFRNLFNRQATAEPIGKYEVHVSQDGQNWTKAHSGTFDTTRENIIYFNEKGSSDNSQLWAYNAKYVKLVAKGATSISIAELDILGPQGDNIEIGMDNNDQVYKNGIGKLKSDYEYAPGQVIPANSILIMGEYKGDPAFNVPLVLNENNENFALKAQTILLANLPEDSQLGEVAEGNWIYWITPEQQKMENNIEGTKVKAELYRYNKLDSQGAPVGQRLVSDTFLYDIDINNLPTIDLNNIKTRSISYAYDEIVKVDSELMNKVLESK